MAELATAGIAALASGASTLFTYNRDAFIFERTLYQGMVHQEQAMRVQEAALYREDLRDLFDLTIKKMDSYLVINTLMLGFAVSLFCTATVPQGTPDWLFWLYSLSLVGSCVFLLLSVWLALQASLTAQSYSVRLLTQWMRLPVPSRKDIEKAASKLVDYERAGARKLLRLPAIVAGELTEDDEEEQESSGESSGDEDERIKHMRIKRKTSLIMGGRELHKATLVHFRLFTSIQQHWAGLDSYSRVFMTIGANQLLQCIGHFSLSYFMILGEQLWAPLSFLLCVTFAEYLHVRLNVIMKTKDVVTTILILGLVPFLSYFATLSFIRTGEESFQTRSIVVLCFFSHLAWLLYTLYQGYEHKRGLPKRFVTVGLVNDILGDGPMKRILDNALSSLGRPVKEIPVGAAATFRGPMHNSVDLSFLGAQVDSFAQVEAKARKLERRIQKLFEAWKSSGPAQAVSDLSQSASQNDFERALLLRGRFRKLQKALQSAGRLSAVLGHSGDGVMSPTGSLLSGSPRSSSVRAAGSSGWLQMRVNPETPGDAGVYFLNPSTGEIRLSAPDLAEGLAVPLEDKKVSARERELRAEMAAFAKFVEEARAIRDERRRTHAQRLPLQHALASGENSDASGHLAGGRRGEGRRRASSEDSEELLKKHLPAEIRHHSTGIPIHGWWIFRQAALLLITAWLVSTVWAVCRWFNVETGDKHVVEGERPPLRERKDGESPLYSTASSSFLHSTASSAASARAFEKAASCVDLDVTWEPLFFPVRMRSDAVHDQLVFTDGLVADAYSETAQGLRLNRVAGGVAAGGLSTAGELGAGGGAAACPGFKFATLAKGGCYGVLDSGEVEVEKRQFAYPDAKATIMDVAVGEAADVVVFLTSDGRLDVWTLSTKQFRRSVTRCMEQDVEWRSAAVHNKHLYVLGVKSLRPSLKRLALDALAP